jgi:hypothetical protein
MAQSSQATEAADIPFLLWLQSEVLHVNKSLVGAASEAFCVSASFCNNYICPCVPMPMYGKSEKVTQKCAKIAQKQNKTTNGFYFIVKSFLMLYC